MKDTNYSASGAERRRWTVSHGSALFSFEADTHAIIADDGIVVFSLKGETVAIVPFANASIVVGEFANLYR